jgi:hypothetical protein
MAANEYYSGKPAPGPSGPDGRHYYDGGGHSSSAYSTPPPYSSQGHLSTADRPPQSVSPLSAVHSPFETVFDDHVYPASKNQTPQSSQHQLSQQDTGYHSLSRLSSEDVAYNHPTDDIPLQNQGQGLRDAPKDSEMQDHVYDASQQQKSRRGRVRFGELGMLGANAKRIPFVVYFFTLVQVAVFIAEIVKNGEYWLPSGE